MSNSSTFKAADYEVLLQQIERFFADTANKKAITPNLTPDQLKDQLGLALPEQGESLAKLQTSIQDYLQYAVKTAHPSYFNQLWGGFDPTCFMGDMLTSATNTSMYTHEVAPVATLIEKTLIAKMGNLVGFENPEGQFTTGGSNGNLMALAIARQRACPELRKTGLQQGPRLIAFVSADSHYSFAKAAHLLGLGTDNLWKVPVDENGRLQASELQRLVTEAKAQGCKPFFVAGTAGTTVRGAYDPFGAIAAIAQAEDLWFHVDGAWGASVLLSPKHRHLMEGVELADSVVWDAHKMMGMTLMCSMLLVKQRGMMLSTFSADDTGYIFHESEADPIDLGPSTMHCGRRVDAVKLWLTWKHLGDRGWAERIDHYFDLAAHAEAFINGHPNLVMVTQRYSLNVCFQYVPAGADLSQEERNHLTLRIRQNLMESGKAMVNYAQIDGNTFFRLILCNNQSSQDDVTEFLNEVVVEGDRLNRT